MRDLTHFNPLFSDNGQNCCSDKNRRESIQKLSQKKNYGMWLN